MPWNSPRFWAFLVLACMVGLLIGLGTYTFEYGKGLSYLSNNPASCMNCHIMRDHYYSWAKASHRAVATCNDCHVPHSFPQKYLTKLSNGWNHSKAFTLQNFSEPIRIRKSNLIALQRNCITCHAAMVSEITGHMELDLSSVRCTDCHRSVGHMSLN